MDTGILGFGIILCLLGIGWLFFISAFYGDSLMMHSHTIIYSIIALLITFFGCYLIYRAIKQKNRK